MRRLLACFLARLLNWPCIHIVMIMLLLGSSISLIVWWVRLRFCFHMCGSRISACGGWVEALFLIMKWMERGIVLLVMLLMG